MSINLSNLSNAFATVGSTGNDRFLLSNSSAVTIGGGPGNDIYVLSATATSLTDRINGGTGYNFIQVLNTQSTTVDLNSTNSSGISAVVVKDQVLSHPSGEVVNVALSVVGTSAITSAVGAAFVSLIGTTGVTNLTGATNAPGAATFLGELNAAGQGFDASGNALTGAALSALQAASTSYTPVAYNLDELFFGDTGIDPTTVTYVQNHLNGYVFSVQGKDYTIWTDGSVTLNGAAPYTVAAPSTGAAITKSEAVTTFVANSHAVATVGDAAGGPTLSLGSGITGAQGAILLHGGTGTIVRGVSGPGGTGYFGLGLSGGLNTIIGAAGGSQFDLGQSAFLQDVLRGGGGFNVVTAPAAADVDLTAGNANNGGVAAQNISAVVGSGRGVQTVEVNLSTLAVTNNHGLKTAEFEAFLGGPASTLTISSGTIPGWITVGTMAPGAPLLPNALALSNAAALNAYWTADGGQTNAGSNAATRLSGTLYEQVSSKGAPLLYVTIWTDATIVDNLSAPKPAALAQAMAQMSSGGGHGAVVSDASVSAPKLVLAASQA
jgi:hypothetical protein